MTSLSVGRVNRMVGEIYRRYLYNMSQLNASCQVKPDDVSRISAVTDPRAPGQVKVTCGLTVCRVPERANHSAADLYVTFEGWMVLSEDDPATRSLRTVGYGTNFGYFMITNGAAEHVLGGHYDFAPAEFGHPRAHMQLRSQIEMFDGVEAQFRHARGLPVTDRMVGVFGRARPATAQMDFLSFLLQVSADHLVYSKSEASAKRKFEQMTSQPAPNACLPLLGYNKDGGGSCQCGRLIHTYP